MVYQYLCLNGKWISYYKTCVKGDWAVRWMGHHDYFMRREMEIITKQICVGNSVNKVG